MGSTVHSLLEKFISIIDEVFCGRSEQVGTCLNKFKPVLSSPILIYLQISSEKKFGGGLKHAVNQVTTQKKATMKKVDSQNLFCKKTKILKITAPPAAKKIYSKMKIALKR